MESLIENRGKLNRFGIIVIDFDSKRIKKVVDFTTAFFF